MGSRIRWSLHWGVRGSLVSGERLCRIGGQGQWGRWAGADLEGQRGMLADRQELPRNTVERARPRRKRRDARDAAVRASVRRRRIGVARHDACCCPMTLRLGSEECGLTCLGRSPRTRPDCLGNELPKWQKRCSTEVACGRCSVHLPFLPLLHNQEGQALKAYRGKRVGGIGFALRVGGVPGWRLKAATEEQEVYLT